MKQQPGTNPTLIAGFSVVFGVIGGVLIWRELGPLAAGGIVSLFLAWSLQRQLSDAAVVQLVNEMFEEFVRDQERITIHLLDGGFPLCGFTDRLPSEWPNNARWVGVDQFDPNYTGDDVCLACLAELGRRKT